jgi:hypothetical protein
MQAGQMPRLPVASLSRQPSASAATAPASTNATNPHREQMIWIFMTAAAYLAQPLRAGEFLRLVRARPWLTGRTRLGRWTVPPTSGVVAYPFPATLTRGRAFACSLSDSNSLRSRSRVAALLAGQGDKSRQLPTQFLHTFATHGRIRVIILHQSPTHFRGVLGSLQW